MLHLQPSNAAQCCLNFSTPALDFRAKSSPSARKRAASSPRRNCTSAKITPLQHKPHSRHNEFASSGFIYSDFVLAAGSAQWWPSASTKDQDLDKNETTGIIVSRFAASSQVAIPRIWQSKIKIITKVSAWRGPPAKPRSRRLSAN